MKPELNIEREKDKMLNCLINAYGIKIMGDTAGKCPDLIASKILL
jgi:hypothetical protein